ncbi:hypothetical protein B0H15DRAFT_815351 [Mycena belliarum]|uniref:Uncharacterized protein n=1 Tax=Mycena belliarum TaxID=1033014 RepID=A0AAD6UHQ0_9AGAR|nr:hypothetical protein B0H15DRAFT_815351 [Mycena belliae]
MRDTSRSSALAVKCRPPESCTNHPCVPNCRLKVLLQTRFISPNLVKSIRDMSKSSALAPNCSSPESCTNKTTMLGEIYKRQRALTLFFSSPLDKLPCSSCSSAPFILHNPMDSFTNTVPTKTEEVVFPPTNEDGGTGSSGSCVVCKEDTSLPPMNEDGGTGSSGSCTIA